MQKLRFKSILRMFRIQEIVWLLERRSWEDRTSSLIEILTIKNLIVNLSSSMCDYFLTSFTALNVTVAIWRQ